jgi:hypothetical protein
VGIKGTVSKADDVEVFENAVLFSGVGIVDGAEECCGVSRLNDPAVGVTLERYELEYPHDVLRCTMDRRHGVS